MRRLAFGLSGLALFLAGCVTLEQEERVAFYKQDGVFLFQRGDYLDARDSFEAALALQPNDPNLYFNIGECCDRLGDAARAECFYRSCLRVTPKQPSARHALVDLLTRTGRQNEADALIAGWLKEDPHSAQPYAEEGWIAHHRGDLPRAQLLLQHALELDPRNRLALTELALVYEGLNRPERSIAIYERILDDDPNQTDVADRINGLLTKGTGRPHPD